jgi:UDP-glucuronate 4-epimerase
VIEEQLGKKAITNYLSMQPGDVQATWASSELLRELTGYEPRTSIRDGIAAFVEWFRDYYQK